MEGEMVLNVRSYCRLATAAAVLASGPAAFGQAQPLKPAGSGGDTVSPAEVVLSRVLFQRQTSFICSQSACPAAFVPLTGKQRIEMSSVGCVFFMQNAKVTEITFGYKNGNLSFFTPMALGYSVVDPVDASQNYYSFQLATTMYIPPLHRPAVNIFLSSIGLPTTAGSCQLFGQLVTLK
jgi:hypothetical protein